MMEQEKKEYKKLREREKEKERERERERAAMEKMAMERRRHEGDYRVIFHKRRAFTCALRMFALALASHKVFFRTVGMEP